MTASREVELLQELNEMQESFLEEGMTSVSALASAHEYVETEIGKEEYAELCDILDEGSIGDSNSY